MLKKVIAEVRQGLFPKIHIIHGITSNSEIAGLYRHPKVKALVTATRGEGFGLPILEAMAQGTPVVTSIGTSTQEVAGGAAMLVDPLSEESIGNGIDEALRDAEVLKQRGRERAAQSTWDKTALATALIYDEVAGA
jgi:glycosyltransferase involved in cell wall biosynthesis